MAKITLGKRPASFKPFDVKFQMPDGTEGIIKATFKYRTRAEFGAMLNGMFTEAGEEKPADGKLDFEALYTKMGDRNADHLLAALDAWSLDDQPLSRATLLQLSNELPAAAVALMKSYAEACTEGRLGN